MQEYSFKTFVTESTERYVYQTKSERSTVTYTNLAPFPSSIVSLAYLDLEPIASLIQTIIENVNDNVEVIVIPHNLDTPEFGVKAAHYIVDEMKKQGKLPQNFGEN